MNTPQETPPVPEWAIRAQEEYETLWNKAYDQRKVGFVHPDPYPVMAEVFARHAPASVQAAAPQGGEVLREEAQAGAFYFCPTDGSGPERLICTGEAFALIEKHYGHSSEHLKTFPGWNHATLSVGNAMIRWDKEVISTDAKLDVKVIRESLGMNQTEFAEHMGVRQATVSDWETGKQIPSRLAQRALSAPGNLGGRVREALEACVKDAERYRAKRLRQLGELEVADRQPYSEHHEIKMPAWYEQAVSALSRPISEGGK